MAKIEKTRENGVNKVLFLLLLVFGVVILWQTGTPLRLYKEYTLRQFYAKVIQADKTNDAKIQYSLLAPDYKKTITYEQFEKAVSSKREPYSYDVQVYSYKVNGDTGIIDRLQNICYSKECLDADKFQNRIRKVYSFINGSWYIPPGNNTYCERKEAYSNPDEMNRALNLVIQRDKESNNSAVASLGRSLEGMKNCISIQYGEELSEEGYFTFDPNNVKNDYYPITVNQKYKSLDDLSAAILLSHEIAHVIQYINESTVGESISCYMKEANAFYDQLNFTYTLNPEEKRTIETRWNDTNFLNSETNPQLEITKNLFNLNEEAKRYCYSSTNDNPCVINKTTDLIEESVRNNPYYQKQCSE